MISNRLWKILVTFKSCKTLSATAERLFVSQPSISSSMKMLEKELGVQLFDRSKNKIVLNEVGLEAAQLAEDYLKREDFMVRQIQEKAWQMRTLTVASYIFNLRKDLISRMSVLFPERNIISEQLSSEQLPLGLLQGRFDYIITEYEIDKPNVCCVPYVTDKLWIRLNKNDPLAHKKRIDINDLKNEKILLWAQSGFWASYIRKQYGKIVQLITVSGEQEYYDLIDAFDIRAFILDTTLSSAPVRPSKYAYVPLADPAAQKTFYLCCQTRNERYIPQLVKK